MDIMASDMDIEESVDTKLHLEVLRRYIDETLTEREKEIILKRYGIGGKKVLTQREIAQKLNISRSYISRIEKKALEKLRKRYEKGQ
jgi:RNA polymerase sporulation-specific sigma factor